MSESHESSLRKSFVVILAIWLLTLIPYSNHFWNAFQFDDHPAIISNPFVTSVSNIPSFFTDPSTNSGVANRPGFRPLLLTTFAIDYWIAGEFSPVVFHITSFGLFLALLSAMFLFFRKELSDDGAPGDKLAFCATALFAVHPIVADCVNYIVQRGEILAALGLLSGLILYRDSRTARSYQLYLIPPLLGALSKETAYVFPFLLFAYLCVTTDEAEVGARTIYSALRKSFPSFLLFFGFALFFVYLRIPEATKKEVLSGNAAPLHYLATQLFIIPDYIRTIFLPIDLSGDTDWEVVANLADPNIYIGLFLCLSLVLFATISLRDQRTRKLSFGVVWFFICLGPTSSISPLTEVRNNHRVFLPLIGLMPSMFYGVYLLLRSNPLYLRRLGLVLPFALTCYGYATFERNTVWRSAESFWRDVTNKSPRNGRGHMNYGLSFMSKGEYSRAILEFEEALKYTPNYPTLFVNLGVALTAIGEIERGRPHFLLAQKLAPHAESSYFFYGRWLAETGQLSEAAAQFERVLDINPRNQAVASMLLYVLLLQNKIGEAKLVAQSAQERFPTNELFSKMAKEPDLKHFLSLFPLRLKPAAYFINTSRDLYATKKFADCISLTQIGIKTFNDNSVLLNNASVCALELGRLAEAESLASRSVDLNPNFRLAQNNLASIRAQLKFPSGDNSR